MDTVDTDRPFHHSNITFLLQLLQPAIATSREFEAHNLIIDNSFIDKRQLLTMDMTVAGAGQHTIYKSTPCKP